MPSSSVSPTVNRVILYVMDIPKVATFYQRFFSMTPLPGATAGWVELVSPSGVCSIALLLFIRRPRLRKVALP